MNLNKVHHVAIIGSDYETSRHFYVDVLGFEVLREVYREDRGDWMLNLKLEHQYLWSPDAKSQVIGKVLPLGKINGKG